jgi:AraC-like DNA-binding protein
VELGLEYTRKVLFISEKIGDEKIDRTDRTQERNIPMDTVILEKIIATLYHKYLIPAMIVDLKGQAVSSTLPLLQNELPSGILTWRDTDQIRLYNNYQTMLASFGFVDGDGVQRIMFIGPCGVAGSAETTLLYNGHRYIYGLHYTKEDPHTFENFVLLLYQIIFRQSLPKSRLQWRYAKVTHTLAPNTDAALEENLYNRRIQESTFDSYQFELRFTEYIKRRESEKIGWLFNKMKETYDVHLSVNELEGLKLKFSAFVAVFTRISISEGVPVNQAFGLSDALIQGLFRIHSPEDWLVYIKDATYRFADMVQRYPLSHNSLLVKTVVNYVDSHIYEKITINDLAATTQKHKSYLSTKFKSETGKTIHQYILERKISEAEHLLLFTDHSAKEVSSLLNFASQSHFIETFKKITGNTPREFQNEHYAYYLA